MKAIVGCSFARDGRKIGPITLKYAEVEEERVAELGMAMYRAAELADKLKPRNRKDAKETA